MTATHTIETVQNRRRFLTNTGMGLGVSAFANVLAQNGFATPANVTATVGGASGLHFPAKAKRVIFLFMAGAQARLICSTTNLS